ncbi:MAG: hypothetical protein HYU70_05690 [Bacteroidetes bacterium]|nr:hypothetical protein [Bacteroidota bacterium]
MMPFTNILISFEDDETVCLAIEKALLIFGQKNTRIHLLKCSENTFSSLTGDSAASCEKEMDELKQKVAQLKGKFRIISNTIFRKNFSVRFKKYFIAEKIDLVMNVQHKNYSSQLSHAHFFYHRLCIKMNVPVLLFIYKSLVQGIRSVFIPITGCMPAKRIQIALDVSARYHAQIYIATALDNADTNMQHVSDSFYQTFKNLTESGHLPLYKVFLGKQAPQAILDYGEQIRADLILINLEKKHSFSEWLEEKKENLRLLFSSACIITMKPHLSTTA